MLRVDCGSCQADTQSDYVEFSNFNVPLVDRKMSRLCGTKDKLPREIVSDGTFFRATFRSNELYDATGFQAVYQFRKVEGTMRFRASASSESGSVNALQRSSSSSSSSSSSFSFSSCSFHGLRFCFFLFFFFFLITVLLLLLLLLLLLFVGYSSADFLNGL